MKLSIDLQDHEGNSHGKVIFTVDDKATVDQLMDEIYSTFQIDKKHQQLFYKERQLLFGTLQQAGIKDENTIVLKHGLLGVWRAYLDLIEQVKEAPDHRKPQIVMKAQKNSTRLLNAEFFECYPNFIPIRKESDREIAHYDALANDRIISAAKEYFSLFFGQNPSNPQTKVEFRPKNRTGIQGGLICHVTTDDKVHTFFLKSHCGRSSRSMDAVDIRELFVYRLLHLIQMGPEVHFVPSKHGSKLYIATKEVPGFKPPKQSEVGNEQLIRFHLLECLFFLADLHSDNYGLDKNGWLVVVDFRIGADDESSDKRLKKFLSEKNKDLSQHVKESLAEWNFPKQIEEANLSLADQKDLLRSGNFECCWSKYDRYLERIKENIELFSKNFMVL